MRLYKIRYRKECKRKMWRRKNRYNYKGVWLYVCKVRYVVECIECSNGEGDTQRSFLRIKIEHYHQKVYVFWFYQSVRYLFIITKIKSFLSFHDTETFLLVLWSGSGRWSLVVCLILQKLSSILFAAAFIRNSLWSEAVHV